MNHPDHAKEQPQEPNLLADMEAVSKTKIKKDMRDLRDLGEKLLSLKPSMLEKLPLSSRLLSALEEERRIKSFNARKRHLNFIGKLMRDENHEPIREFIQRLDSQTEESARHFHQLERWRQRLLEEGNTALTEYLCAYPQADHQYIRQLVRNALKEKKENKPPAQSRKLFRYLRDVCEATPPETV